jgi:hypothetical protein
MQLRKKVEFKPNMPVQVALAYDNGILKQDGRFGDYWIYSLEDERVMFVPPVVHDQIEKLNISRGQPFRLTKQEKRVGNKRVIEWLVEAAEERTGEITAPARAECSPRTHPESPVPPLLTAVEESAPAESPAPQVQQEEGKQENGAAAGGDVPQPASAGNGSTAGPATAPEAETDVNANGAAKPNGAPKPNGAAKSNGAAKPNGAEQPSGGAAAGEKTNTSPLFRASMRAAIDALIDAEAYAAKKNYCVRFTNEDLRATAISIFIAVREGYSR